MKLTKAIVEKLKATSLIVRSTGDGEYEHVTEKSAWNELKNLFDVCKQRPWNMSTQETSMGFNRFSKGENSIKQIISWLKANIMEMGEGYVFSVLTGEEENECEQERERKEIERAAADFARECGFPVATPDFIRAIRSAINKQNAENEMIFSGEARMERFAACRFAGCSENYWSDEDYISSQQDRKTEYLERVLTWLEENCPLLVAKVKYADEE